MADGLRAAAAESTETARPAPVLLYDGVCGICNRGIQTILRHDRDGSMRFAPLQGDFAEGVIARHPELRDVDSMVFVENPGTADERVTVRTAGMLRVADYLGGPWKLFLAGRAVPAGARDRFYDWFASIRYRVFGRHDTCPIPAPEVRARFID
ncbi:DCC1-like thiol-disulfide oxidoreductase family protein [Mycobacterium sp. CPCC 205372]|uniref:DCC1-like thiol-disulfide oxidoreductase family protein n=1 Tax=Mycobacterium hippophais TaxID=3016340 RepID=A0ABT4PMG7_9MYCO|nr:DCC1-like thiol-disulfide oxidoreductase family protein [Mycobacterium hippophais]MCZ8377755.1 DCC1-like thiol-disulfide oxidoreductase family protein [Mycobacterium hippophais]